MPPGAGPSCHPQQAWGTEPSHWDHPGMCLEGRCLFRQVHTHLAGSNPAGSQWAGEGQSPIHSSQVSLAMMLLSAPGMAGPGLGEKLPTVPLPGARGVRLEKLPAPPPAPQPPPLSPWLGGKRAAGDAHAGHMPGWARPGGRGASPATLHARRSCLCSRLQPPARPGLARSPAPAPARAPAPVPVRPTWSRGAWRLGPGALRPRAGPGPPWVRGAGAGAGSAPRAVAVCPLPALLSTLLSACPSAPRPPVLPRGGAEEVMCAGRRRPSPPPWP